MHRELTKGISSLVGLCRHQQAEFFFESAFGHDLDEVVLHVFHVGAFAADASGCFGVGVIAFAAELVHDVEPVECLGVACGKALFELDKQILFVKIAVQFVAIPGKGVYVAIVDAGIRSLVGIAVACAAVEFLALAALGVFALFVAHAPIPDFGDVGGKGNISARLEIRDCLAEKHIGCARQVFPAFGRAGTPETEVGVNQVGILCHECGKVLPENGPKGLNFPFVGFRVRGGLGARDEVVDFGGGCLDFFGGGCLVVERHKLLLGCVPLSGRGGFF